MSDSSLYANDSFNMGNSNRHVCLIPQIESVKGVENIDEIAAVEGVTGLMFGPGDFSADAGLELKLSGPPHPEFVKAMTKFVTAAKKHNRALFGYVLTFDNSPSPLPSLQADKRERRGRRPFPFRSVANRHLRGAQHPSIVPMMIDQGYAAIAVAFDVWAVANLVNDSIKDAKAIAQALPAPKGKADEAEHATNGTTHEMVNGKAPPS